MIAVENSDEAGKRVGKIQPRALYLCIALSLALAVPSSIHAQMSQGLATGKDADPLAVSETIEPRGHVSFLVRAAWWEGGENSEESGIIVLNPREPIGKRVALLNLEGDARHLEIPSVGADVVGIKANRLGFVALTGKLVAGQFKAYQLSDRLQEVATVDFLTRQRQAAGRNEWGFYPVAVYDYTIVDGLLFGYGVFKYRPQRDFDGMGFFVAPLGEGSASGGFALNTIAAKDEYYRLGFSYITSIGSSIYFIPMSDSPELHRYDIYSDPAPVPMGYLPIGDSRLPKIELNKGDSLEEVLRPIGGLNGFPFALLARDSSLYCLTRSRSSEGLPIWELEELQIGLDAVTGVTKRRLPTQAEFIRVVSSPESLYILEKDADSQFISRVVSVRWPSSK